MARAATERPVQVSLIDRLIDLDPRTPDDPPVTRAQSIRQLKAAVRRDLEWLLNTRSIPDRAPESFSELQRSLYHFGLPDITSMSRDDPDTRHRLLRVIEEIIARFEPRLAGVRVSAVETTEEDSRKVRFLIQALLRMDPVPEQVSFDTILELGTGECEVVGERGA